VLCGQTKGTSLEQRSRCGTDRNLAATAAGIVSLSGFVILTAYGLQQMLMMMMLMMTKSFWLLLLLLTLIATTPTKTAGRRSKASRRKYYRYLINFFCLQNVHR